MLSPARPVPDVGIHYDIEFDEYTRWDAINNSRLKVAAKSLRHFYDYPDTPRAETPAMRIGRLVHLAVLEPRVFRMSYDVMPDFKARLASKYKNPAASNEYKQLVREWREAQPDVQCLSKDDHSLCTDMQSAVYEQLPDKAVLEGPAEACVVWRDFNTDLLCKARLDKWCPERRAVVDLKTCEDASPEGFKRAIRRWRYYQQMAFYCDGVRAITGEDCRGMIVAVEKEPPYACKASYLSQRWLEYGRREYQRLLSNVRAAMTRGIWEGYPHEQEWDCDDWDLAPDDPVSLKVGGTRVEV